MQYHDNHGYEIRSFQCPRKSCIKATIQVQKGIQSKVKKATILGNAFALAPNEKPPRWGRSVWRALLSYTDKSNPVSLRLPLGENRGTAYGWVHRWLRWFRKQSIRPVVTVDEQVYGRHMNIFGRSGMGKSKLIVSMAKWIAETGQGGTIIDPAGDLVNDILRIIPESRRNDVLLIRVSDLECPFRMNVLEAKDDFEEMNLNEEVLMALNRMSKGWGDIIESQIEMAIESVRVVGGSLNDVYNMFARSTTRHRTMSKLDPLEHEELLEFWERYERETERSKAPVKRKLRKIVKHPLLGPMIGAKDSNFDPDTVIRERKLVLVDLSTGSASNRVNEVLGTLLITKIMAAAFRQQKAVPDETKRVRHFLIVDEARNFMSKGMDFEKAYSEARKAKLSLCLANQHITQLSDEVKDAAFNNAAILLSFNVDNDDAKLFAQRMHGTSVDDFNLQ